MKKNAVVKVQISELRENQGKTNEEQCAHLNSTVPEQLRDGSFWLRLCLSWAPTFAMHHLPREAPDTLLPCLELMFKCGRFPLGQNLLGDVTCGCSWDSASPISLPCTSLMDLAVWQMICTLLDANLCCVAPIWPLMYSYGHSFWMHAGCRTLVLATRFGLQSVQCTQEVTLPPYSCISYSQQTGLSGHSDPLPGVPEGPMSLSVRSNKYGHSLWPQGQSRITKRTEKEMNQGGKNLSSLLTCCCMCIKSQPLSVLPWSSTGCRSARRSATLQDSSLCP